MEQLHPPRAQSNIPVRLSSLCRSALAVITQHIYPQNVRTNNEMVELVHVSGKPAHLNLHLAAEPTRGKNSAERKAFKSLWRNYGLFSG